jgi:hypothetical protein
VLTYQRALRNLWIGIILFVGTLVPEIERLRNKALEKRQRRITELQNLRIAAEQAANQLTQQQADQDQQREPGQRLLQGATASTQVDPVQPLFGAADTVQNQLDTSNSGNETSNRLRNDLDQARASAAAPHLQNNALGISGESTPLTPAELLDPQHARDGLNGDEELFDPPFDEATLAAALAGSTGANGAADPAGSLSDNTQATAGSTIANGPPEGHPQAGSSNGNARFARIRDGEHEVNNLHLQLPSPAERARAATGQDPDTPLLSPGEQDTDDETEGERREDGEGVDDEVGM